MTVRTGKWCVVKGKWQSLHWWVIPGLPRGVFEISTHPEFYTAYNGSFLRTFRHNRLLPSSLIPWPLKKRPIFCPKTSVRSHTILRRVKSQKSSDLAAPLSKRNMKTKQIRRPTVTCNTPSDRARKPAHSNLAVDEWHTSDFKINNTWWWRGQSKHVAVIT